jgi:hypothetical protein
VVLVAAHVTANHVLDALELHERRIKAPKASAR